MMPKRPVQCVGAATRRSLEANAITRRPIGESSSASCSRAVIDIAPITSFRLTRYDRADGFSVTVVGDVMMNGMSEHDALLAELRPRAFAIAYRMLGTVS